MTRIEKNDKNKESLLQTGFAKKGFLSRVTEGEGEDQGLNSKWLEVL